MQVAKRFLAPKARVRKESVYIHPSHEFEVWHKVFLFHSPLPFAPDKPPHRNVIRAQPPLYDAHGRVTRPGVFDTALFVKKPAEAGLNRMCRFFPLDLTLTVCLQGFRAIFTLPAHLCHLHPGPLAYLELFTRFDNPASLIHRMHTLSHNRQDGRRRSLILPVASIAMGCHLAPCFDRLHVDVLAPNVDTLAAGRHFFLNHYYNYFFFQFVRYWHWVC